MDATIDVTLEECNGSPECLVLRTDDGERVMSLATDGIWKRMEVLRNCENEGCCVDVSCLLCDTESYAVHMRKGWFICADCVTVLVAEVEHWMEANADRLLADHL